MAAPLSCDHCEELLADYLLHALEPEAVQAVTEHLSTCERCRAQLTASEAVLDHLAQAVPQRPSCGARVAPAGSGRRRGLCSRPQPQSPSAHTDGRPGGHAGPSS